MTLNFLFFGGFLLEVFEDQLSDKCISGFDHFTGMKMSSMEETASHVNSHGYIAPYTSLHNQVRRLILWLLHAINCT